MNEIRGDLHAAGRRFAIAVARFNEIVTRRLLDGALDGLRRRTGSPRTISTSCGSPARSSSRSSRSASPARGAYDAVICLGAVIRGETAHFEQVAGEAAAGIRTAAQETGVPVVFGVLTTESLEQAMDRAGGAHGNKGWDAATRGDRDGLAARAAAEGGVAMIVDKPWGKVVTYALNQPSSVRVITVEPGQETSVHYHQMRDEMWVVLDAGLNVQIGNRSVEAAVGRGVHGLRRDDPSDREPRNDARAGSWRSPTATRPRTTRCDSRTTTAGRWSPTGRHSAFAVGRRVERPEGAVLRSARPRHRRVRWQSRAP